MTDKAAENLRPRTERVTEPDLWRKFHADIRDARVVGVRRQIIEDAARDYADLRVKLDRIERDGKRATLAAPAGLREALEQIADSSWDPPPQHFKRRLDEINVIARAALEAAPRSPEAKP